jgi:hypothetical protein
MSAAPCFARAPAVIIASTIGVARDFEDVSDLSASHTALAGRDRQYQSQVTGSARSLRRAHSISIQEKPGSRTTAPHYLVDVTRVDAIGDRADALRQQ